MEEQVLIPAEPPPEAGQIFQGDCISVMAAEFPPACVDMIYADPPYNASGSPLVLINNKTGGPYRKVNAKWDTFTDKGYWQFTENWLSEAFRVLKPTGGLFVACSMHNIGEVMVVAKRLGFLYKNIFVWRKTNAMPNITKRTFTHSTEYTCWFVKGPGWTFNYTALKRLNPQRNRNGGEKQMPDFVELPLVQGAERLRGKDGRAVHPTQKPEKLLEIFITAASAQGELILDPFMGTGTTAVVADRLGREWIGVESSPEFVEIAKERIWRAREEKS